MHAHTSGPTAGELFAGRYLVDERVGQGGFAQVWRATHVDLGAPVALKILSPPSGLGNLDADAVQASYDRVLNRFRREAKTISLLRSPYTISALDFGQHEGVFFMALEFIDGHDLESVLSSQGPLPPARVLPIARQILESLAEAHALGVLHRDIKPSNIMLYEHRGRPDLVKVLDFGIAAVIDASSEITSDTITIAGALVGTPRFMPPEHILGHPETSGSDLYSLGLTLSELLTGHRVVDGGDLMPTLFSHASDEPHVLPDHPHVSPELGAILARMIAKDPAARYARADDVIADLAALATPAPAHAPPRPPPRPPRDAPGDGELTPNELDELVQGRDSWWHFLDAKSRGESLGHTVGELGPQVAFDFEDDPSLPRLELDLDLERVRARARPRFQPHALASLSCSGCGALVPADLTFCVYCGGEPRFRGAPTAHLLVIDAVEDAGVLEHVSSLLQQANDELDETELLSALAQPPAVFFFHAFPDHASALTDRLGEIGVSASLSSPEAPSVSIAREVQEAIRRDKRLFGGLFVMLALWTLVAFTPAGVPFAMFGILATVFGTMFVQRQRYEERYSVDPARVLELLNGLDGDLPESCARVLSSLRDDDVRGLLTVCLMEYYAIWRHLSSAPPHVIPILGELKGSLDDLLREILDACSRYADLHSYLGDHSAADLSSQEADLAERVRTTQDEAARRVLMRELEQRRKQLATTERIESILPRVRERLEAMRATMESLRARVVAVTSLGSDLRSLDGDSLEVILAELDDEVTIFEQTVAEAAEVVR